MNHKFLPSQTDALKCGALNVSRLCQHPLEAHTDKAECDFCTYIGPVEADNKNNLACPDCLVKQNIEYAREASERDKVKTLARDSNKELSALNSIETRADVFNAHTPEIIELKRQIMSDESITNKPFAIANALMEQFSHLKKVIFEAQETVTNGVNKQRAIQVELNQLANSLRTEEREKLKISDINYKPDPVKPAKAKTKTPSKKIDKAEVRHWAAQLGVPEFMLQTVLVAKSGITVAEAAKELKRTIDAMKSASQ